MNDLFYVFENKTIIESQTQLDTKTLSEMCKLLQTGGAIECSTKDGVVTEVKSLLQEEWKAELDGLATKLSNFLEERFKGVREEAEFWASMKVALEGRKVSMPRGLKREERRAWVKCWKACEDAMKNQTP